MTRNTSFQYILLALALCIAIAIGAFYFISNRTSDDPITVPVVTDPVTDPVTEPLTDPVTEPVTDPVTEPVTEPPLPEDHVISFVGCGDNLLYRPNTYEADELANGGKRSYMFMYENVADFIAKADIAFVNQETLLTGGNSGYPLFDTPFELADTLAELGFDVANIATNHMLDYNTYYANGLLTSNGEGILISRDTLKNAGLTVIGGYEDADDLANIRIVEREGLKIAFLAFTEATNMINIAENGKAVVPYLTDENVRAQVKLAKEVSDFIIVSAHWGADDSPNRSESQRQFSKLFAELGVDVVLGHGPHILHPIEWIEGKDGHKMLCAFSLGNFVGMMEHPLNILGGFITFDIHYTDGEKPVVKNVGFVPTVYHYNFYYRQNKLYFLTDYTDVLSNEHGVYTRYYNHFTNGYLKQKLESIIRPAFIRTKNDY